MDAAERRPIRIFRAEEELDMRERVVITGIGMVTSVGRDRESSWSAVRSGKSNATRITGLEGLPDNLIIGAPVPIDGEPEYKLKVISLNEMAAAEAMADARISWGNVDYSRFGCAISSHMGDCGYIAAKAGQDHRPASAPSWWQQFFPDTSCNNIAKRYALGGPSTSHATACASSTIDVLSAARLIEDGQADLMLAGCAEAIHPLVAAGFHKMRVLAEHQNPIEASRPFDRLRNGFVMGEGGAMLVLESLGHALQRNVPIYAEIVSGSMLAEGQHVTNLNADSDGIVRLIQDAMQRGGVRPEDLAYINAHGTGTEQNDLLEMRGIRRALGSAADHVYVSSMKSMLGHLVNASGAVELALTVLALRDGFLPPTINLTEPDPECTFDCLPLVGKPFQARYAMKLSVAFGGHLASVIVRRWPAEQNGFGYPARIAA